MKKWPIGGEEVHLMRSTVAHLVERSTKEDWTVQGLGMARLRIGDSMRIHVWSPDFGWESDRIHTHPWSFTSFVLAGSLRQDRLVQRYDGPAEAWFTTWNRSLIRCGEGGGIESAPTQVHLAPEAEGELIRSGEAYRMEYSEIHATYPDEVAITLVHKHILAHVSPEHANVYWRGERWKSAEPQPATTAEWAKVVDIVSARLG